MFLFFILLFSNVDFSIGECPKMEISMLCNDPYFAIWGNDGSFVYDSYLDGPKYSRCYNPADCFSIEFDAWDDACDYTVSLNEEVVAKGRIERYEPNMIRVGSCPSVCDQGDELFLLTYIDYSGDMNYTLDRSGKYEDGFIKEGDAERLCLDMTSCNIVIRNKQEWSYYYLFNDGKVVEGDSFEKYRAFGECSIDNSCSGTPLKIVPAFGSNTFNYELSSENQLIEKGQIDSGSSKDICLDLSKCYELKGTGNAHYTFFNGTEVTDHGLSTEFSKLGDCEMICDVQPELTTSLRGKSIIDELSKLSDLSLLQDVNASQYKSACWLVYDDKLQMESNAKSLFQRYILGLIYESTNGGQWTNTLSFMESSDECEWDAIQCDDDGHVTKLNLQSNNLVGTLVSEIYSLSRLEFLVLDHNKISGSIPFGASALPLQKADLSHNKLSGEIPSDFFLNKQLMYVYLDRNNLTGQFPKDFGDLKTLELLWIQKNKISGTIPAIIGTFSNLTDLSLYNNQLTGKLPAEFSALENLERLDVSNNTLDGGFPEDYVQLSSLRFLQIENNLMTGTIPFENCEQFSSLRVDCAIECKCCDECFNAPTSAPTKAKKKEKELSSEAKKEKSEEKKELSKKEFCAGPHEMSKQCGAVGADAVPYCCSGLVCSGDKTCVDETFAD